MPTSLIRSRAAITGVKDRFTWNEIKDGAVLQEDGVIVAVGTYDDLHRKHPTVPVIGTGKEILLPGFVNGHHHVGLTPVQLGSPDMPLELWFITRMVIRNLDLYLDTLYSAFEMIGSGITTVQHIQGWMPGMLPDVEKRATETIRAYEDVGMRVSYCYAVRDQNRLVYQADEEFVASLPKELQGPMQRWFDRFKMSLDDAMDMFKTLPCAASQQAPGEDPARAGQPALVLRQGADAAVAKPRPSTTRRCTCTWSRPPTRRNTPRGAATAPRWNTSTASAW